MLEANQTQERIHLCTVFSTTLVGPPHFLVDLLYLSYSPTRRQTLSCVPPGTTRCGTHSRCSVSICRVEG